MDETYNIILTNRFHLTGHLFSNRPLTMSKCGENKKWHTKRSMPTMLYYVLTSTVICKFCITEQMHSNMKSIR